MMTVSIMAMVLAGTTAITMSTLRSYSWTSSQYGADMNASVAVQKLSRDLSAAKQVSVQSSSYIRVFYPTKNADGTYNRTDLDSTNYVDFYRSTIAGVANASGDYLYRKPAVGSGRVICKGVTGLTFTSTSPSSVDIVLSTKNKVGSVNNTCDMTHRAIFLRNY